MKLRRFLTFIFVVAFLLASVGGKAQEAGMDVYFFDVGKADAILITCGGTCVMIDCGTDKAGKKLVEVLSQMGIRRLDLLVITHFDKDHVGGADRIIDAIQVDRVIEPGYDSSSKQTRQYREALEKAEIKLETLLENVSFDLGGAIYEIDVANQDWYGEDEENDFSLVVRVEYGNTSFLFAGDAENLRLLELLEEGVVPADVLKVPHHGCCEERSASFFAAAAPRFAVITSDEEKPEDPTVVALLEAGGAQVLLTRQGTVHMHSNGITVLAEQW